MYDMLAVTIEEEVTLSSYKRLTGRNTLLFLRLTSLHLLLMLWLLHPTQNQGLSHFGCAKGGRAGR